MLTVILEHAKILYGVVLYETFHFVITVVFWLILRYDTKIKAHAWIIASQDYEERLYVFNQVTRYATQWRDKHSVTTTFCGVKLY